MSRLEQRIPLSAALSCLFLVYLATAGCGRGTPSPTASPGTSPPLKPFAGQYPIRVVATPGLGIRYFSPVGPIRIDVGYNARGAERLSVVTTELVFDEEEGVWVNGTRLLPQPAVDWAPHRSFLDRLQVHFSIGQAF
jgi:outer membrane protein assembly factor BamA